MKTWMMALMMLGGMAMAQEKEFFSRIREMANDKRWCVYNVCLVKDGVSHTEVYTPAINCHNCYSITKLYVVTAIGILEDRGKLSVDDKLYPILKEYFPENFDLKWKDVTLRNVMTHRTGFGNGANMDIDAQNMAEYPSEDMLKMALSAKLEYVPGTKHVYTDTSFYLLSRVVTAVTGEKLDDFLTRELFRPLKYREYAMSTCPYGYPIGGTGLYVTTADMAKLGQVYLQNGVYDGKRILSERFVKEALGQFELHRILGGYAKGGMNGQLLYLNQAKNIVVAIHGFEDEPAQLLEAALETLK